MAAAPQARLASELLAPSPQMFIGGAWHAAVGGRRFEVIDPSTLQVIRTVPDGAAEEARAAVDAAFGAFASWSGASGRERSRVLLRFAELMREQTDAFAEIVTAECGKPLKQARGEVRSAAAFMSWYAEEAKRGYGTIIPAADKNKRLSVIRQPAGVAAAVTPWNFPIGLLGRKVAAALAAGCTVVAKPASETPLSALVFAKLGELAGLPAGAFNVVTGDPEAITSAWLDDPRVRRISFTGSTEVGKLLAQRAAVSLKRISLELGGSAPYIVFEDADLELAVAGLLLSKIRNAGQVCAAPNRIYVHRAVYEEFLEKLVAMVDRVGVGNGREPHSDMGPLIDEAALRKVNERVAAASDGGASVHTGGIWVGEPATRAGAFARPQIVTGVSDDAPLVREETFGPVLPVMRFEDDSDAIVRANHSVYGLGAYVFTRDLDRAWRVSEALDAGIVGINDALPAAVEAPFGGTKQSGYGREGGAEGLLEFLEEKTISLQLSSVRQSETPHGVL